MNRNYVDKKIQKINKRNETERIRAWESDKRRSNQRITDQRGDFCGIFTGYKASVCEM